MKTNTNSCLLESKSTRAAAGSGIVARLQTRRSRMGALLSILLLTASQVVAQPYTLWDDATLPAVPSAADPGAVELGVLFQSSIDGVITGIRFYKGPDNPGPHVGHLWSASGTLLASVPFEGETAIGWQTQSLTNPVPITSNTTYVVSYHAPAGGYSVELDYLVSGYDNPPLRALADGEEGLSNGRYAYGPSGTFPVNSFRSANYFVDVVLDVEGDDCAGDTNPPVIVPPEDVLFECRDCTTDPDITGRATATDECDFVISYADKVSGDCPKVIKRTWTATDNAGNTSHAVQKITCLPPSAVTDTAWCLFDRDPSTDVQDFRLLFIQDPLNRPCYRLGASNPGQFRYNVFKTGVPGAELTFNLTIPFPFVTQGANPIHAYDWATVEDCQDAQCVEPGDSFHVSGRQIILEDYDLNDEYPTTTVPVTLTVPDSGLVFISIHLDYGLKRLSGYDQGYMEAATACLEGVPPIPNHAPYTFSVEGAQDGSTTILNDNTFKRIPGVAGLVLTEGAGDAVPDTLVLLLNASGDAVGGDLADEDGFYGIPFKHKGKASNYSLVIATPEGHADTSTFPLKANGFEWVDFLVPAGP